MLVWTGCRPFEPTDALFPSALPRCWETLARSHTLLSEKLRGVRQWEETGLYDNWQGNILQGREGTTCAEWKKEHSRKSPGNTRSFWQSRFSEWVPGMCCRVRLHWLRSPRLCPRLPWHKQWYRTAFPTFYALSVHFPCQVKRCALNLATQSYLPQTGFSSYVLAVLIMPVMLMKYFPNLNLYEYLCRFIHV